MSPGTAHGGVNIFGFDLSEMPIGMVTLSNVIFDVRGVVQLVDGPKQWQNRFETKVSGIKVGQKLKRLQILHGANVAMPAGHSTGQAASYVMHYADGSQVEFPIIYGRDLLMLPWVSNKSMSMQKTAEEATIAWRGMNSSLFFQGLRDDNGNLPEEKEIRIFKSVWENPRPDEEIASIDYVSTMTKGLLPFLIAITVEL